IVAAVHGSGPKFYFLAVATRAGIVWAPGDGDPKDLEVRKEGGADFTALAFASDVLAAGTSRGGIHLWKVTDNGIPKALHDWRTPGGTLMALAMTDSGDGPRLTTVSALTGLLEVRVWDPKTAKELSRVKLDGSPAHRPGSAPIKVVLSPDGKRVAV